MKFLITLIAALLYTVSAFAQVATIPIMADRNNEPHDYSFAGCPCVVPTGVNFARFVPVSKDQLRNDGTLTVVFELSLNNGISWNSAGGEVFNAVDQPKEFFVQLAQPTNTTRIIRGRATLFGDRWKGGASVLLEE